MDAYSADAALKRLRDLLTVRVDVVGEKEVELSYRDVDVVGVDAESWVEAVWRLF